jgi:hypothetical protein
MNMLKKSCASGKTDKTSPKNNLAPSPRNNLAPSPRNLESKMNQSFNIGDVSIDIQTEIKSVFCSSLVCVMRDFKPESGTDLKNFLEKCLKSQPGVSKEALSKNRVQECIKVLFKRTDIFSLSAPG